VPAEGLVKKDQRTMRKLKRGFSFSLGWENADMIEKLTVEMIQLDSDRSTTVAAIESTGRDLNLAEDRQRLYAEIRTGYHGVSDLESDASRVKALERDRQRLLEENPDYRALRLEAAELETKAQELGKGLLKLEAGLKTKQELLVKVEGLIPTQERELKGSRLYRDLCGELGDESRLGAELETELGELEAVIQKKAVSRLQFEAELQDEAQKIETARGRAISFAARDLGNYRHNFNDPNLPYELGGDFSVGHFIQE
jgi:hypothetical protein